VGRRRHVDDAELLGLVQLSSEQAGEGDGPRKLSWRAISLPSAGPFSWWPGKRGVVDDDIDVIGGIVHVLGETQHVGEPGIVGLQVGDLGART